MLKPLHEIQTDYAAIVAELLDADGELTPELEMALAINRDELEVKAEGYALRILDFNGQAALVDAEIKRLQGRKAQYEKTSEKLVENIHAAMMQFKVEKIKTLRVTLSFRKSEVCTIPETFADEVLKFVNLKAEIDQERVNAATKLDPITGEEILPAFASGDLLQYFKLSATVDKAKIKIAIKEGTTVGDAMILSKQNLQIK